MPPKPKPEAQPKKTSAERTRAYRARMRARGLKPVTIWAFDTSDPEFRKRLAEDSRRLRESPGEKEIMDWIEAVQIEDGLWD